MPSIEIIDTGWVDRRDSAFPQAVKLSNDDILCSFNVGGGPYVHGGTDWARSTDGGLTWTLEGTILPPATEPPTTNALKLTRSADGETIFAYGSRSHRQPEENLVRDVMNRSSVAPQTAAIRGQPLGWSLCLATARWRFPTGYCRLLRVVCWRRQPPSLPRTGSVSRYCWLSPTMVGRPGLGPPSHSRTPTRSAATSSTS